MKLIQGNYDIPQERVADVETDNVEGQQEEESDDNEEFQVVFIYDETEDVEEQEGEEEDERNQMMDQDEGNEYNIDFNGEPGNNVPIPLIEL